MPGCGPGASGSVDVEICGAIYSVVPAPCTLQNKCKRAHNLWECLLLLPPLPGLDALLIPIASGVGSFAPGSRDWQLYLRPHTPTLPPVFPTAPEDACVRVQVIIVPPCVSGEACAIR